jgi:hypothetical protein
MCHAQQVVADRLAIEMGFPQQLAQVLAVQEAGPILLEMRDNGEELSEENPLLLLVPSFTPNGILYWKNGNYGLPVGAPGHAAAPAGMCMR